MILTEASAREQCAANGQEHVFRFWRQLNEEERRSLLAQISTINFPLMNRLIKTWVHSEPDEESFLRIDPIKTIPTPEPLRSDAREALDAGEAALRAGRVGVLLVAGGQGTRLGFDGPKGAYPVGPITGRSLFAYHADKIINLEDRYHCVLPWYVMVSEANAEATQAFFEKHAYFGLEKHNVRFFKQRMVPCVNDEGKFMLDAPGRLAMNPNGHGGSIPGLVENGILEHARSRGVDTFSYFQVDNWAAKVADPFFIGYHLLGGGEMSSKICRKTEVREAVGVHCLCDGEYRVIEYSELDLYPQLLDVDEQSRPVHYAGNPAMHILSSGFVEQVHEHFSAFPWHRAHKKIPYIDEKGERVQPEKPNGFKFETFVFDALRFIQHEPIAVELDRAAEYTPIKVFEGTNSVVAARANRNAFWGDWLEAASCDVQRDANHRVCIDIEISPRYALTKDEFLAKTDGCPWPTDRDLAIDPAGTAQPNWD
jgi:UDP-N-acetylglucosamine/UDP-N-acetylgalactosamine diphosphorylase